MTARAPTLFCLCALAAACDDGSPPPTGEAKATSALTVAIGTQVLEVPFDHVACTPEADATLVQLTHPRDVPDGHRTVQRPRVLIARVHGDRVIEANAFVPQARLGQTEYAMMQLVAGGSAAPDADCRLESADGASTLVCNHATILPWLEPGPRPTPSFKVTYRCPAP